MKTLSACVLLAIILSVTLWAGDAPKAAPSLNDTQKREAVTLVRNVSTAEFAYRAKAGKFGTVTDLIDAGLVKIDNPAKPLPDFKLRIVVPAAGDKFQLSLIHATTWGLFTDEQR